ncbi:hypothetical protein N431DRAFT_428692 [Stipitochalara longipes BDJ]|nr:hypothetical protein N431DRAFT_428692 [Stipitochalara longipes BDJ]
MVPRTHPTTYGFAPLQYVGSNFSGAVVPSDGSYIEGFDQAGFVENTSPIKNIFIRILADYLGDKPNDIA